uniref:Uncharacterized protein n=1 Tax=Spongospora subterranea TaxID=70186 RepID=A0A0H5QJG1_9EUKA|eukprot:CRZ02250.1 hypothetical protein [Spongospora subterranea]
MYRESGARAMSASGISRDMQNYMNTVIGRDLMLLCGSIDVSNTGDSVRSAQACSNIMRARIDEYKRSSCKTSFDALSRCVSVNPSSPECKSAFDSMWSCVLPRLKASNSQDVTHTT